MKTPSFWYRKQATRLAKFLLPVGRIYGAIVAQRAQQKPAFHADIPVFCVGNIVMGGGGKTPVVQAIVKALRTAGKNPAILLRGYGGYEAGPLWVDALQHDARMVGDEALLHAAHAPTLIARDRAKGAKTIAENKAVTHIIMDDGLQNPSLYKNQNWIVVDGSNPVGNNLPFPAGPLREEMDVAVRRAQALVVIGEDATDLQTRYQFLLPVLRARLQPIGNMDWQGKDVIAFAGIARPERFFKTVTELGAVIVKTQAFADHHAFTNRELDDLLQQAQKTGAVLVTTRKDWVRLAPAYQAQIQVVDVALVWDDEVAVQECLKKES